MHGTVYDSTTGTTDSTAPPPTPGAGDYGTAESDPVVTDVEEPQPTFTPADDGPVTDVPDANAPTLSETDNVPVVPASDTKP